MPRSYRLGERAVTMDETRRRIVDAAIDLYIEFGMSATTLRQVGQRSDVAPGTLRSHFPTRDLLDAAMVERLTAEVPLPELSIFDGARSTEERLGRLIGVTGTFFDQAARLYRMWLREPMVSGVWAEAGAAYGARWDQLMRAALGPLADDDDAVAVLRAVLDISFFERVGAGVRTTEQVSSLVTATIVPWFTARSAERLEKEPSGELA